MCACMHMHLEVRGQFAGASSPSTVWVAGVAARSSALVADAFTHQVVSLGLQVGIYLFRDTAFRVSLIGLTLMETHLSWAPECWN